MRASPSESASGNMVGSILFLAVFLFLWVGINPYVDLTGMAILDPSASNSNQLNQIITIVIFVSLFAYGLAHPLRSIILQPRGLLLGMLFWFTFVCLISNYPMLGIKSIILSVITLVNAAVFLLLPSSERQFGKLLAIGTLIMLGFAFFGVIFKPTLSIHQASELREPMNAGFWRGHFPHKNSAAAAMVLSAFFGLFIASSWSRPVGYVIVGLSAFFLMHTGGKTAAGMLPAVLIIAWFFERYRILRIPIVIGGVVMFNMLAVGSAVIEPFREFVSSLGIDATFTNRADIWRFAFAAIAEHPIVGYGIKAFWQTPELVYSGAETWAAEAYNGHNSYLEIWLTTGFPGLILTLIFIIFLPLKKVSGWRSGDSHSNVTRLFVRVWIYSLYNAGLEVIFFDNGSFMWFIALAAIYSFSLRTADLVKAANSP